MIDVWHAQQPTWGHTDPDWPSAYTKVATVETDDLDLAYSLTNHINRAWFDNPGVTAFGAPRLRSTSVGDVLVKDGTAYRCAIAGWQELPPCAACGGQRWLIVAVNGNDDDQRIERCDNCAKDLTDADVRALPAAQQALREANEDESTAEVRKLNWTGPPPIHCPKCAAERGIPIPAHCPHRADEYGVVLLQTRGPRIVCTYASSLMPRADAEACAAMFLGSEIVDAATLRNWKRFMVNGEAYR